MYNFIVVIEKPATNFQLGFKEHGLANAARVRLREAMDDWKLKNKESRVTIKDDYGREMDAYASNISSFMIEDHQQKMQMTNEQNIDTARANESFVKRRNEDMELMRLFPTNTINGGRA